MRTLILAAVCLVGFASLRPAFASPSQQQRVWTPSEVIAHAESLLQPDSGRDPEQPVCGAGN